MNIFSLIIICTLYLYGIFLINITFLARKKGDKGAFINNCANTLIYLSSISVNLVIYLIDIQNKDYISFPYDILMFGFILIFLSLFFILMVIEKQKIKKIKNPSKTPEIMDQELPLKYDVYRKLTHIIVLGIIIFYFSIFLFEGYNLIFNQDLVFFLVGISLIGLLTADIVRILKPDSYPLKSVNRILRENELHSRFGPQISMSIGCFSIILIFTPFQPEGPLIICLSITMSIFGDIVSNLIGRIFGRKKIRYTKKTYEGFIAGIIVAYLSGLLILALLKDYYLLSPLKFFFIPFLGSLIIGFIDYLNLEINDNLTYPFILTITLYFMFIIIP